MIEGRVWKYGDDINTDLLFPGKFTYTLRDPAEIASHALEDLDPAFAANVQAGDIVVGGRNFGCGSSREQGATCLVYNGVGAVVAHSFGRIFYRNALNNGLLALTCAAAANDIQPGEPLSIDLARHIIVTPRAEYPFPPLSQSVLQIVEAGGLIEYVKKYKLDR